MRLIARLFAALAVLLLAGCQSAFYAGINLLADDAGISEQRGIVFDPVHDLALDIYRPRDLDASAPLVVFVYGGSWRSGERGWNAFVGRALARRGAVVVIPDYRKAPAVAFPAFVEDVAWAVAWSHRQAAALGADPDRIHLMGHSAGAHIAALLATDRRYLAAHGLEPGRLAGMIGLAGPYDFLPLGSRDLREVFDPPERHADSQPVNFVDGDEPPFLLLNGREDRVVIPRNSQRLAALLRAKDVPVTVTLYDDLGHPGILLALSRTGRGRAPVLADITRWLQLPPAPSSIAGK